MPAGPLLPLLAWRLSAGTDYSATPSHEDQGYSPALSLPMMEEMTQNPTVQHLQEALDAAERRAERLRARQEATYRIAEAALESRDTQELFQRIHSIMRDMMPAENLFFALWDPVSDIVSFPYWVDAQDPPPEPGKLNGGLTEYVLRSGQPLLIDDAALDELRAAGVVEPIGTLSLDWLGVPLRGDSGVFGALVIQSYEGGHHYSESERDLLVFVSAQVAMAIERTRAEAEQRVLTAAMDCAVDPVFGVNAEGRFVFVNQAACSTLGYSREELLGMGVWDIDPRLAEPRWTAAWKQTRDRQAHLEETLHLRKDGSAFPVEISRSFLAHEGREVIFTNVRDITERKVAEAAMRAGEEALRTAERRLRTVVANSQAIIYQLDPEGRFTLSEGLAISNLGLKPGQVVGQSALELYQDNPAILAGLREALSGHACRQILQQQGRTFDNLLTPVRDDRGQMQSVIGIATDVTERQQAEDALLAERSLFIGGPVMVFMWRAEAGWPVEYASPNVESILGYPVADLIEGKISFESLIHPEDVARLHREIQDSKAKGLLYHEQQYRMKIASGDYRWFYDFSASAELGPDPSRFPGYLIDITDRRLAEESLRQSQKLESLGILAGGIAHDFNNLLTVVLGNLNLAQMHLPENTAAQPYLANMEATVLRATELTKQMLAYSGRGHFLVKPQDLSDTVREVAHLLEVSISKKVRLRFDLEPGLPAILADAAQIQQVVMNLVTNASDAIGDREGVIHLSTALATLDERELRTAYRADALQPGPYVVLEVADTGNGIAPEVMPRIFDPFFTTKATGRGLGLSAMLGILRGHGAALRLESEVGRGTSFRLCFPASSDQPATQARPTESAASSPLKGRILLVDDEDLILQTIGSALITLGMEVVTARDGLEALERFREASPRPDLVLMDLTMPRMDGREAFRAMHDLDPSIPVVLSSGYSEQDSLQTLSGHGPAGFMQKPYLVKELRKLLERLLGS